MGAGFNCSHGQWTADAKYLQGVLVIIWRIWMITSQLNFFRFCPTSLFLVPNLK